MKRKLPQVLAILICLSLVGCASSSETAQPDEPSPSNQTVADQLSNETTPTETDEGKGAVSSESSDGSGEAGTDEDLEAQARESLLKTVFQGAYDRCVDIATATLDEHLKLEVQTLTETGPMMMELPDEYDLDYLEWRVFTYGTDFKQGTSETQESQNTNQTAQAAPNQNTATTTNKTTTPSTPTQNQGGTQSQPANDRALGGTNGSRGEDYDPRETIYAGMTEEEIQAKMDETIQHIIDSGAIIQGPG